MDTYFKQAMLDTQSFTIIQNALGRSVCPEKLEGRAKERLDKLKVLIFENYIVKAHNRSKPLNLSHLVSTAT